MTHPPQLTEIVAQQPYPHLFVTISGAHLYGFPSPNSDYDLRGVHVLPVPEIAGLDEPEETVEYSGIHDGLEIDLVTHDIKKFFLLLLKRNGYVLEQLYSPLIVHSSLEHVELKTIARNCITRHHAHHYRGFAKTQWDLFDKERPRRIKPLLYVYRVLLAGIHLMKTGEVQANLVTLNDRFRLSFIQDLVDRKLAGDEQSKLQDGDIVFYQQEYVRLLALLEAEQQSSTLPETPSCRAELNDLLLRVRLKSA